MANEENGRSAILEEGEMKEYTLAGHLKSGEAFYVNPAGGYCIEKDQRYLFAPTPAELKEIRNLQEPDPVAPARGIMVGFLVGLALWLVLGMVIYQQGLFDQPQYPPNPYKEGSQSHRIYHRLIRWDRVSNIEIMLGLGGPHILNGTDRTSKIRAFLKPHGIKLHRERVCKGLFEYRISP